MWTRSYRIIDYRADPNDTIRQIRDGLNPGVRLVMDNPIGREIRVTIEQMERYQDSYKFKGFLDEYVEDRSVGLRFCRETDVTGNICYWKGFLTMAGLTIGKGGGKDEETESRGGDNM